MADTDDGTADLKRFWEFGVPLKAACEAFAVNSDRFAFKALRTHPDDDSRLRKENPSRYEEIKRVGWLPASYQDRKKQLKAETRKQRFYLLRSLYAGQLISVGKHALDGSDGIERIPEQYYFFLDIETGRPFADIAWSKGKVRTDTEAYFQVRVVQRLSKYTFRGRNGVVDLRVLTKSKPTTIQIEKVSNPGRPSSKSAIWAAIAAHAKKDPTLSQPRKIRFKEYRAHMSQNGYDLKRPGFSDKTLEKYETEFRRETN